MILELQPNQVAVLDYSTRQVSIVTLNETDSTEIEEALYGMGYDMSNCYYMS